MSTYKWIDQTLVVNEAEFPPLKPWETGSDTSSLNKEEFVIPQIQRRQGIGIKPIVTATVKTEEGKMLEAVNNQRKEVQSSLLKSKYIYMYISVYMCGYIICIYIFLCLLYLCKYIYLNMYRFT